MKVDSKGPPFFMRSFLVLFFTFLPGILLAQAPHRASSSDIFFKLKRLSKLSNVLYIAAHPDDENTHLLTYFMHEEGVNATYYSLTRGDGGQNILGTELGDALGVIRTMEMYEARKIDKAHQRFGTAFDFGFSKSPEETFNFWNKDSLVKQTIDLIQELQPDLIICRFPTTGEGGHGHHTASAIIAQEAFKAIQSHNAKAPLNEQWWLPTRLIFNAFNFRTTNTIKEGQIKLGVNQYQAVIGKTYSQLAGESRSVHHSQGVGTPERYGPLQEYFALMEGRHFENDIWEDIDKSWKRIGAENIEHEINQLVKNFNFLAPELHFDALIEIRTQIQKVSDPFWKAQKLQEVDDILYDLLAIRIQLNTLDEEYMERQSIPVTLKALQNSQQKVEMMAVEVQGIKLLEHPLLIPSASSELLEIPMELPTSITEKYSQPYWLVQEEEKPFFPIQMNLQFQINDDIVIERKEAVTHYYLDPIWGDKYQYTRVKPASLEVDANFVLRDDQGMIELPLFISLPDDVQEVSLKLIKDGRVMTEERLVAKAVSPYFVWHVSTGKESLLEEGEYNVYMVGYDALGHEVSVSNGAQKLISYDHIPHMPYFKPAKISIIENDFKYSIKHIGYIEGVGDEIPKVLSQIGIQVTMIEPHQVKNITDLNQLDAIIVGIRAYNRVPELMDIHELLKKYVHEGGRMIVQYNTNHELISEDIGFEPLVLSRDRVTEEDAAVEFLLPHHSIVNHPHQLSSKDFDHWIQERGLYYPSQWSNAYTPIFSMSDTGEPTTEGALLVLDYGQGSYIYTGFSFFRQLPIGHKGAMRLLLNMLEYSGQ